MTDSLKSRLERLERTTLQSACDLTLLSDTDLHRLRELTALPDRTDEQTTERMALLRRATPRLSAKTPPDFPAIEGELKSLERERLSKLSKDERARNTRDELGFTSDEHRILERINNASQR